MFSQVTTYDFLSTGQQWIQNLTFNLNKLEFGPISKEPYTCNTDQISFVIKTTYEIIQGNPQI